MVKKGTITPVNDGPSDFVSALIVVQKSNKKLCICTYSEVEMEIF